LLNDEDFLFTEHGHGKLFGESLSEQLSDGCQMVVRVVVKGLLSEGFCQSDRCQRAAVRASVRVAAVRVAAVGELLSEGFCQSAAVRGLLSEWLLSESKSATKLLHSSVLVIYTARNLPKRQP
jgi:hypothetical protein